MSNPRLTSHFNFRTALNAESTSAPESKKRKSNREDGLSRIHRGYIQQTDKAAPVILAELNPNLDEQAKDALIVSMLDAHEVIRKKNLANTPYLVPYLYIDEDGNRVMRQGSHDLAHFLNLQKTGGLKLTPENMKSIMARILLDLEFLHANNVVHLDIKPDNIIYFNYGKEIGFQCALGDLTGLCEVDPETGYPREKQRAHKVDPEYLPNPEPTDFDTTDCRALDRHAFGISIEKILETFPHLSSPELEAFASHLQIDKQMNTSQFRNNLYFGENEDARKQFFQKQEEDLSHINRVVFSDNSHLYDLPPGNPVNLYPEPLQAIYINCDTLDALLVFYDKALEKLKQDKEEVAAVANLYREIKAIVEETQPQVERALQNDTLKNHHHELTHVRSDLLNIKNKFNLTLSADVVAKSKPTASESKRVSVESKSESLQTSLLREQKSDEVKVIVSSATDKTSDLKALVAINKKLENPSTTSRDLTEKSAWIKQAVASHSETFWNNLREQLYVAALAMADKYLLLNTTQNWFGRMFVHGKEGQDRVKALLNTMVYWNQRDDVTTEAKAKSMFDLINRFLVGPGNWGKTSAKPLLQAELQKSSIVSHMQPNDMAKLLYSGQKVLRNKPL